MQLRTLYLALFLWPWAVPPALAQDCTVIAAIERITAAHQRVITTAGPTDAVVLARNVAQLDQNNIYAALDGVGSNAAVAALQAYVYDMRPVPTLVKTGDFDTLQAVLIRAQTSGSLSTALQALRSLSCDTRSVQATDQTQGQLISGDSSLAADSQRRQARTLNVTATAAGAIATLVVLAAGFLGWRAFLKAKALRKRRGKRYLVNLPIEIRLDRVNGPARVIDLSCRGAKLRCGERFSLTPGQRLHLLLNENWRPAFISWSNQHYCGIQFDHPLPFSEVKTLAKIPAAAETGPRNSKTAPHSGAPLA